MRSSLLAYLYVIFFDVGENLRYKACGKVTDYLEMCDLPVVDFSLISTKPNRI